MVFSLETYTNEMYAQDIIMFKRHFRKYIKTGDPKRRNQLFVYYSKIFCYFLYYRVEPLLSHNELNSQNFSSIFRTHSQLATFRDVVSVDLLDGLNCILEFIAYLCPIAENCFFHQVFVFHLSESRRDRELFLKEGSLEKETPGQRENLLNSVRRGFNKRLKVFLESLVLRQKFAATFLDLSEFSSLDGPFLENLVNMDRQILSLLFELLFFAEEYQQSSAKFN